jgi:hypothetical protein
MIFQQVLPPLQIQSQYEADHALHSFSHATQQDHSQHTNKYSCWLYPVRSFRHSYGFPIRQQHSPRCGDKNAVSEASRAAYKRKRKALSFLPMK